MKYKVFILFILILSAALNSCSFTPDYPAIFEENNQTFQEHKSVLINAVHFVKNNYSNKSVPLRYDINYLDSIPQDLKEDLIAIGIDGIAVFSHINPTNQNTFRISFNVNRGWNIKSLRVVKIGYDQNDKQTIKGAHYYDGYHIDIWGQGDDFYILSDTDFI